MKACWNEFTRWAPPRCRRLQWVHPHLRNPPSVDGPNLARIHRRQCTLRSAQLINAAQFGSEAVGTSDAPPCNPAHVGNPEAWLNRSIRNCAAPSDLTALLSAPFPGAISLNPIHLAVALTRLARMQKEMEAQGRRQQLQQGRVRGGAYGAESGEGAASSSSSSSSGVDRDASKPCASAWQQLPPITRELLLAQLHLHADSLGPRQAANILWAAARLGGLGGRLVPEHGHGQALLRASLAGLPSSTPQELSLTLYALARLGWSAPGEAWVAAFRAACRSQWWTFSRRELSMLLLSLASLGWQESEAAVSCSHNAGRHHPRERGPPSQWLGELLNAQAPLLSQDRLPLCQLSGSLWALARMRITPPPSWSAAFVAGVQRRLCGFSGPELAALAWALPRTFGSCGAGTDLLAQGHAQWTRHHEAVAEAEAASQQSVPASNHSAPGSAGRATAARWPPLTPAMLLSRLAKRVMKRCRQLVLSGAMQPSHMVTCCHASTLMPAGLLLPANIWLEEQLLQQLLGGAEVSMSSEPQQAGVLLCALTRDTCQHSDPAEREATLAKAARYGPALFRIACQQYVGLASQVQPSDADPPSSSSSSSSGSGSGSGSDPALHRPLADAAPPSIPAGPLHPPLAGPMIALLGAAALLRLGPLPTGFMATLQRVTYAGRWELSPSELSALLEALGRLGARPGRSRWLGELLLVLHRQVEQYSTAQLIKVVWSLAQVGYCPSAEWVDWVLVQLQRKLTAAGQRGSRWDGSWDSGEEEEEMGAGRAWLDSAPPPVAAARDRGRLGTDSLASPDSGSRQDLQQQLLLLRCLPRLAPGSEAVVQWMEELVNGPLTEAALRGELSPQDLAHSLWSAGHLANPMPLTRQGRAEASTPAPVGLKGIPLVAAAGASVGFSRGGRRSSAPAPPPPAQRHRMVLSRRSGAVLLSACHHSFMGCTALQLGMAAYGVLLLGLTPSRTWLEDLVAASLALGLPRYSDRELSLLVNAAGRLLARQSLHPPRQWKHGIIVELGHRAPQLQPAHVLGMLLGLSAMGDGLADDPLLAHEGEASTRRPNGLSSFIYAVSPSLLAMPSWQLELSYQAAISLQPEMAGVWGQNFQEVLQPQRATA